MSNAPADVTPEDVAEALVGSLHIFHRFHSYVPDPRIDLAACGLLVPADDTAVFADVVWLQQRHTRRICRGCIAALQGKEQALLAAHPDLVW